MHHIATAVLREMFLQEGLGEVSEDVGYKVGV